MPYTLTAEAGFTRTYGTTSKIYDVQLAVNQTDSIYLGNSNVSAANDNTPMKRAA